jgi:hypothetical protein
MNKRASAGFLVFLVYAAGSSVPAADVGQQLPHARPSTVRSPSCCVRRFLPPSHRPTHVQPTQQRKKQWKESHSQPAVTFWAANSQFSFTHSSVCLCVLRVYYFCFFGRRAAVETLDSTVVIDGWRWNERRERKQRSFVRPDHDNNMNTHTTQKKREEDPHQRGLCGKDLSRWDWEAHILRWRPTNEQTNENMHTFEEEKGGTKTSVPSVCSSSCCCPKHN